VFNIVFNPYILIYIFFRMFYGHHEKGVENPVPRVAHPDWLKRKVKAENAKHEQKKISSIFAKLPAGHIMETEVKPAPLVGDIEDSLIGGKASGSALKVGRSVVLKGTNAETVLEGPCPDREDDFEG
jgi:DNA polymerase epsilon subunit 1